MNLYQEEILDHYKHPRNKKRLENPSKTVEAANPVCGDKLGVDIVVKDGIIVDIGFFGEGCAISQAAMSMLSEELIGQPDSKLGEICSEYVLDLLGVPVGPSRLKCALLCLQIVDKIKQ